ncbi:MAG: NUDIX hydrolase [Chryseolinea sp.]
MDSEIARIYGDRVRVRVCGILFIKDSILLVNHKTIIEGDFWAPPGGGLEFGETFEECLMREMREESGLEVKVLDFGFGCEYIRDPLHAVELFFWIEQTGGVLRNGNDPELQIIEETRFITPQEIASFKSRNMHSIFRRATTKTQFLQLKGFYRI